MTGSQTHTDRLSDPPTDVTASLHRMRAIVGRKWQPLIVYQLRDVEGMGFSSLKSAVEGISSKMLSESLDDLEASGVVEREIVSDQPVRVAYSLTEAGEDLVGIVSDIVRWEREHLDDPTDPETDGQPAFATDGGEPESGDSTEEC